MLAIVIPYYKISYFEATLESLMNQTDKRFKVYIGDDASPENPKILLEKYKGTFDFVYHRFEKNLGSISLVHQWNRCIEFVNDEKWLMILGDDDFLENNVIEEFYLSLSKFENKTNVVRFASKTLFEENQKVSDKFEHPKWEKGLEFYFRKYKGLTRSSLSEYIFSKEAYFKYRFREYPLGWYSDDMAWIDFSEDQDIYSINNSHVIVRLSKINITGKKSNLLEKNKAEELFYTDFVQEKLKFVKNEHKKEFLMAYEIAIKKNRKVTIKEWMFLLENYIKNKKIVPFLKCNRRFFRDYLFS